VSPAVEAFARAAAYLSPDERAQLADLVARMEVVS
jgi:hypothetical protein